MNTSAKYINLNFAQHSIEEITSLCTTLCDDERIWVQKCARFALSWLNDNAFIEVESSGTTGTPKKYSINKSKITNSSKLTASTFNLPEGNSVLLCLSTDYIAGKMMLARSEVNRWNLFITEPSSNPLVDFEISLDFAAFVPNQIFEILHSKEKEKLNSIKKIIIGGGEINESLKALLKEVNSEVYQTFGMTETVSHVAVKQIRPIEKKHYTALNGIHFSTNSNSCLVIHAPQLEETPIETNDCIELINATNFIWLGRFDNIINSGGIKINPENLEQKIKDQITNEFIVSSIPDDKLINKLIVLIEGKTELNLEKINASLGKFEQIKELRFIAQFDRTASGKIIRPKTNK